MATAKKTKNGVLTKVFSYVLPIISAITVVFLMGVTVKNGVKIRIDCEGNTLGYVKSVGVYEEARHILEDEMSDILGIKYKYDANVSFEMTYGEDAEAVDADALFHKMFDMVADERLAEAYALYVDGHFVAANEDFTVLQSALDAVTSLVDEKYEGKVEIANTVYFQKRAVAKESVYTKDELVTLLLNATVEYAEGETVALRAHTSELEADCNFANTYYTNVDFEGENSTLLLYKTTVTEEYEESVPYKTVYRNSANYYDGITYVSQEGQTGLRSVVASASYINGEEVERVILSAETITEPVEKIVLVGTKPKPPAAPTGTFILPLNNPVVTSPFGWRDIFGGHSFHGGIDFNAAMGTMIYACDGGVITRAQYSGTYGLMIEISHGGKYKTIYAHLSGVLVEVGDKVYQGQPIGLSGNSGRVTGPHLHLEIYEQGVRKDPAIFLKKITPDQIQKLSQKDIERLRQEATLIGTTPETSKPEDDDEQNDENIGEDTGGDPVDAPESDTEGDEETSEETDAETDESTPN